MERSLFRVWLSYTFNNLRVMDGCVSPSKYVQVILTMGCIVGCGGILALCTPSIRHLISLHFRDLWCSLNNWRREWDSKAPANVDSTRYRATDGSFGYIEQCKAVLTAGE